MKTQRLFYLTSDVEMCALPDENHFSAVYSLPISVVVKAEDESDARSQFYSLVMKQLVFTAGMDLCDIPGPEVRELDPKFDFSRRSTYKLFHKVAEDSDIFVENNQ